MKPVLRTKSIGTKITETEYVRLEELAGKSGLSMSEWVRKVLLDRLERQPAKATEETVLAELLGLRTILLNLLFTTAKGETLTAEQMQSMIEKADSGKIDRARKLLEVQRWPNGDANNTRSGRAVNRCGRSPHSSARCCSSDPRAIARGRGRGGS